MGTLPTHKKNVSFSWPYAEDLVTALGKPPLRDSACQPELLISWAEKHARRGRTLKNFAMVCAFIPERGPST